MTLYVFTNGLLVERVKAENLEKAKNRFSRLPRIDYGWKLKGWVKIK